MGHTQRVAVNNSNAYERVSLLRQVLFAEFFFCTQDKQHDHKVRALNRYCTVIKS
jgi:hypothetical protein